MRDDGEGAARFMSRQEAADLMINPFHLKELLGHSDLKLTERYSHLSDSVLKQAALRVQNG